VLIDGIGEEPNIRLGFTRTGSHQMVTRCDQVRAIQHP